MIGFWRIFSYIVHCMDKDGKFIAKGLYENPNFAENLVRDIYINNRDLLTEFVEN